MSRELTDSFKLSVRSCQETVDAVAAIRANLAQNRKRKVPVERVVNWALHYLAGLPAAEQLRAMEIGQHRLDGDEAGAGPPIVAPGTTKGRRRATRLNPAVTLPPPSGREPDEPDPAPAQRHSRVKRAQ